MEHVICNVTAHWQVDAGRDGWEHGDGGKLEAPMLPKERCHDGATLE